MKNWKVFLILLRGIFLCLKSFQNLFPQHSFVSGFQVPTDVEKCQDRVECFNADLKADMDRWQNNKRQDFRQLLMGMADKNIQYYEKVML